MKTWASTERDQQGSQTRVQNANSAACSLCDFAPGTLCKLEAMPILWDSFEYLAYSQYL